MNRREFLPFFSLLGGLVPAIGRAKEREADSDNYDDLTAYIWQHHTHFQQPEPVSLPFGAAPLSFYIRGKEPDGHPMPKSAARLVEQMKDRDTVPRTRARLEQIGQKLLNRTLAGVYRGRVIPVESVAKDQVPKKIRRNRITTAQFCKDVEELQPGDLCSMLSAVIGIGYELALKLTLAEDAMMHTRSPEECRSILHVSPLLIDLQVDAVMVRLYGVVTTAGVIYPRNNPPKGLQG